MKMSRPLDTEFRFQILVQILNLSRYRGDFSFKNEYQRIFNKKHIYRLGTFETNRDDKAKTQENVEAIKYRIRISNSSPNPRHELL